MIVIVSFDRVERKRKRETERETETETETTESFCLRLFSDSALVWSA